ncbi:MAG TPA: amino acid adenylation domain-containing protein, partial [Verrucomicrobiota bacterium]|nr:amino acid adenylation domain-containing protein [Verrucomicrobiota bacterium]
MPESEKQKVLVEWNDTQRDHPSGDTLISLFEEQVRRAPDRLALISGTDRLTYEELNARANRLAHHLRALGIGPESLVAICHERSWKLMVAILGALKAGGAYVPLDPAYPRDRLAFILRDTNAPVVITQESLRGLTPPGNPRVLCLDSDWGQIRHHSRDNPAESPLESNLAYIIYTSGSTGQPKGVAIEHRHAVALLRWADEVFSPEETAGVLASTSICFDLSVFEMFVPLARGGTVIMAENALALPRTPAAPEVTLINTVPSAMRELLRIRGVPPNVRVINLAGEPLSTELVNQIHAETQVRKVYDLYGPTETTTYSTGALRQPGQPATIGRPLANERVYLLDRHGQPVPIGVPGEIHIGGAKVARGYWKRPDLTAERFVPDPFRPGARLYRTGDLARWREDGTLEYLGRADHQIKIRGFRVEPGEIEAVLKKHPAVRDAVVIAWNEGDSKHLAAYAVPALGQELRPSTLKRFAREHLPDYMVPSAVLLLEALPLTPNGKVNRKALPRPEHARRDGNTEYVAPRSPVEEQLAALWREILRVQRVGIKDNFFELGGHSLLAIQVVSKVREVFKVELPLFSLFDAPTIEALANGLASGQWTGNQLPILPLQPIPRGEGRLPASFVQERLWFLDQLDPGTHAYNVPIALRLRGPLNLNALQRALNEIARRHESLRTRFAYDDGVLSQIIAEPGPLRLDRFSLECFPEAEREARLLAMFNERAQQPFDLAAGPLLRLHLARLSEHDHALLLVMHHIISDGWSLTIFFQELEALYNAFADRKPDPALPGLPVQYADFAHWKRQSLHGVALDRELRFWTERLAGAPPSIALPPDPVGNAAERRAERKTLRLPAGITDRITALSQRESTTPFAVLFTALAITLEKWTRQHDMVIGTVVAGRNRREIENVIGCFMNFLPIRTHVAGQESGLDLLRRVKGAVLDAQSHQDCPFEKIVEAVNPERRQDRNPLYNVALLLQNFPPQLFNGIRLSAEPIPVEMHDPLLDIRLEAEVAGDTLLIACEYKTNLFAPDTVDHFLASYCGVLERLLSEPGCPLSRFALTKELAAQAEASRKHAEALTLAVAATFTAEPVEESLRYWSNELELTAQIEFAPYNQVFQQLLDPLSVIMSNTRGLNVLLVRFEDWLDPDNAESRAEQLDRNAREFVAAVRNAAASARTPFLIILCPPSEQAEETDADNALERAAHFTANELEKAGGVHVVTTRELLETYPVARYHDRSSDELGRVPYTPEFFTALGTITIRKLHALRRTPPKVIVLDCDQTLWSGVCGEDGARGICIDAPRRALQEFMRAQHDAGRLLAICSKNNEDDVRDVFRQRSDMPLRAEQIAAWRLNWQPKSENIRSIARELDLGLESFVFLDDNPVECAEVEANCPEVLTLQLPEDPAQIPQFLRHCWIFDTLKVTEEDRSRTEFYRQNRERARLRSGSMSLADFIAGLQLQIEIAPMAPEQLARVSQLTQRTNQFNCTTIRRTEAELQHVALNSEILAVSAKDRFGDYGLVGAIVFSSANDGLDVDTFLLSCRVLGRGVEHAMLAHLGRLARERKLSWVLVHFHPSARNKPAADFLQEVGAQCREALNGGYVYRFPAKAAEATRFNPNSSAPPPEDASRSRDRPGARGAARR